MGPIILGRPLSILGSFPQQLPTRLNEVKGTADRSSYTPYVSLCIFRSPDYEVVLTEGVHFNFQYPTINPNISLIYIPSINERQSPVS